MTEHARIAIYAAKNRRLWGRYAARKFCLNRGVHITIYRLAVQLEATVNIK